MRQACIGTVRSVILVLGLIFAADTGLAQSPGVVSYTYRNQFPKDVPGTLDRIRSLGIKDIEFSNLFGLSAIEMRRLLDERGIQCSSFGVGYEEIISRTDEVAGQAKTLGAKYVRVAWIPHSSPFTVDTARKAINDFNRVGKKLLDEHELHFCYHNHGYEFVPYENQTLFDWIVQETDPRYVGFELDILWAAFPGANPAELIDRYPDRIKLLHLKDLKKGVIGDLTGKTDPNNDVALGTGQIDISAVLDSAKKAAIEHYYIEDESNAIDQQVPESIRYLEKFWGQKK